MPETSPGPGGGAPASGALPVPGVGSRRQLALEVYRAWPGRELRQVLASWERDFSRRFSRVWRKTACTRCGTLATVATAVVLDPLGTAVTLRHWRCPHCLDWDCLRTAARRFEWIGRPEDTGWQVGFCGPMLFVNHRCVELPPGPAWVLDPTLDYGDVNQFAERLSAGQAGRPGEALWVPKGSAAGVAAERVLETLGFRIGRREPLLPWQPLPVSPPARRVGLVVRDHIGPRVTPAGAGQAGHAAAPAKLTPHGIAVSPDGRLWAATQAPSAIVWGPDGQAEQVSDVDAGGAAAIAVRGDVVYVASRKHRTVWRPDLAGRRPPLTVAGTGERLSASSLLMAGFMVLAAVILPWHWGPLGAAVVVLNGVIAAAGLRRYVREAVPAREARFARISGLACAPDGSLYIADAWLGRVRRVAPSGRVETMAGLGARRRARRRPGQPGDSGSPKQPWPAGRQVRLLVPRGLAVAADGTLRVADSLGRRVLCLTPDGRLHAVAGGGRRVRGDGGPATSAALARPWGVAVGPDGSLYVADRGNHSVRRVGPNGIILTWAGSGASGRCPDGAPARSGALARPVAVAVTADGGVYVAERGNRRVRLIAPGEPEPAGGAR